MKHYEVDVDITMSCRIEVDAESEEQAKTIVGNWIDDDPWHYVNNGHCVGHKIEAVNECEKDDKEQLSFNQLIASLNYFSVDNMQHKTIGEIADECREFIRKSGHQCLDDGYDPDADAKEWAEEHHPEWTDKELEPSAVVYSPLQFLCKDEFGGELYFANLNITFYGDYQNGDGVFSVTSE